MKLLIDADLLLWKFGCGNQQIIEWDEGLFSSTVDLETAKSELDEFIKTLKIATDTEEELLCLSSSSNFRKTILPTYKANRKDKPKPALFYDLKQYMLDNYPTKIKDNLEADDVCGILSTLHPNEYVIASIDKDLNQICGLHYNWNTQEYYEVPKEEANYNFYMQVLTGDSTDNYGGCPGVGKKKAEKILNDVWKYEEGRDLWNPEWKGIQPEHWSAIVSAYESKGLSEEDALIQARVARILRKDDYDFKKGEVRLWKPC